MRFVLAPVFPLELLALAFLIFVGLELVPVFGSRKRSLSRTRRAVIGASCVLATLAAFLPLLRPSVETEERTGPSAWILVDASRSMATRDARAGRSRYEAALEAARSIARAADGAILRTRAFPGDGSLPHEPTGTRTPLGDEIARAFARGAALPEKGESEPGVVVLLSDGGQNEGTDPVAAARDARSRGARVFTIGLGDPDRKPPPRIASLELRAPDRVRRGETATVRASVLLEGLEGLPAEVELSLDGESVGKVPLEPTSARSRKEAVFELSFPAEGERMLVATARAGSRTETAERRVRVVQGELGVALLDRPGRWEHRYLKRALEEASGIRLSRVDLWRRSCSRADAERALAAVREADVIVLGDFPAGALPQDPVGAAIRKAVDEEGKGLLVLGGPEALSGALSLGLGPLLPVEAKDDLEPTGPPFRPAETEAGRTLLAGSLGIGEGDVRRVLGKLPMLETALPLGAAREHASVLLESNGRRPLLLVGRYGLGRTAVLGTDETWRWAFEPESPRASTEKDADAATPRERASTVGPRELHRGLFLGLVSALASREAGLRSPVLLSLESENAAPGEPLSVSVEVAPLSTASRCSRIEVLIEDPRQGRTVASAQVPCALPRSSPPGKTARETLELRVPEDLGRGLALVRAIALDERGEEIGRDVRSFSVLETGQEDRVGEPADLGLLARIADTGGGSTFAEDEVARGVAGRAIAAALEARSSRVRETVSLASGPGYLLVLTLLLGVWWAARRTAGLG